MPPSNVPSSPQEQKMMPQFWDFIPTVSVKYNDYYRGLSEQAAKTDPFANIAWIAHASNGRVSGVYLKNELLLPCQMLAWGCIGFGSYANSELKSPIFAVGEYDTLATDVFHDLPGCLIQRSIHGVFIDGPEGAKALSNMKQAFEAAGWTTDIKDGKVRSSRTIPPFAGQSFSDVVRAHNAKEARDLRAIERKLSKGAGYSISRNLGTISNEELDICKEIEEGSWKAGKGIFSDTLFARTKETLQSIPTLTSILSIDGVPVAWDINIIQGNTLYNYNRAYKEAYKKQVPGKLLFYKDIQYAWENGVTRVELLGNRDAFKDKIANEHQQRHRMICFSPKMAGRMLNLAYRFYTTTKSTFKKVS